MSLEHLKTLNKPDRPLEQPENLLEEYNLKIPFYGIPPEVLETLVLMMTETAKYQAPMQEQILKLPTWDDWMKDIQPTVSKAMNGHTAAVKVCESSLKQEFQSQMDTLKKSVSGAVTSKISGLEQTLKARDNTPTKLRWKWIGIGSALPILLSGLLWLLKTFLL